MTESLGASEWTKARGEKWRSQLGGMEAMLTPVDEPLLRAARLDAPYRIADVGCGGGATTLEILRHAPKGSAVHGYDISPDLIESARTRSAAHAVRFEIADMSSAAPTAPYERLLSRFGVMFFDDPVAAFANLYRWLAPGGRFAFAVWAAPVGNPWMTSVRQSVAETIALPPSDPDAPGLFRYADEDKFLALLAEAGFDGLEVTNWRGQLPIGGGLPAAEAAHFALATFGSFAEQLAQAGPKAFGRAHEILTAHFSGYENDGAVRMAASVHIVTGSVSR